MCKSINYLAIICKKYIIKTYTNIINKHKWVILIIVLRMKHRQKPT